MYSRDIATKTRSQLNLKQNKGEFIGSFVPYGYQKDPDDKHKLLIDTQVAPVIVEIFSQRLDGKTGREIAQVLNVQGIPSPQAYKRQQGIQRAFNHNEGDSLWTKDAVYRILRDCRYTGDFVAGKQEIKTVGSRKATAVPKENWVVLPDVFPAIISKETFDALQNKGQENTVQTIAVKFT